MATSLRRRPFILEMRRAVSDLTRSLDRPGISRASKGGQENLWAKFCGLNKA